MEASESTAHAASKIENSSSLNAQGKDLKVMNDQLNPVLLHQASTGNHEMKNGAQSTENKGHLTVREINQVNSDSNDDPANQSNHTDMKLDKSQKSS